MVETPNNVEVFPEQRVETPIIIDFPAEKQSEKDNIIFIEGESNYTRITAKEARKLAENIGFKKINETSHGQPVFYNKKLKKYITPDVDRHNGGVWKMADSVKELASKKTRLGTYDAKLNRIGD
ncbi:toxin C-terminal domain-containing protein [uncultured Clostridium sp.]|uniref:toxin C-terminal domain-containing protein n=1 Tax=uncultured Clostridium sp. TaxID=59620 RepID=UPI0028E2CFA1|nr:toxin C-terminal domain-containing protein [uncultured Clostridium sp.]